MINASARSARSASKDEANSELSAFALVKALLSCVN